MALYFLSYDLRGKKNYQPLYDELARFKAVRVLESTWCFNRYDTTVVNMRNHFEKFIDSDDGIALQQVATWATTRTQNTPNNLT